VTAKGYGRVKAAALVQQQRWKRFVIGSLPNILNAPLHSPWRRGRCSGRYRPDGALYRTREGVQQRGLGGGLSVQARTMRQRDPTRRSRSPLTSPKPSLTPVHTGPRSSRGRRGRGGAAAAGALG